MSLRNTSGKFSLPSFGRKATDTAPNSPGGLGHNGYDESTPAPQREGGGMGMGMGAGGGGGTGGAGGGGIALDGLGRKLGKSLAHQSLLPGLGNKDFRVLQDVISAEKGVLQLIEKLGAETQKAAAALPAYGAQEGPDLQDVLTHSSTLLNQLGTALSVFVDHSANLRTCYKQIRQREEELDDLRRRRRSTGQKAEAAEKKLAKMSPENKGLPSQTELLERLRVDMRQMDTDIISEESKLGDFKRQMVKEALSSKFGGLEELGEKMCIIGELGKLLLEEVPLEETPPGYGRAPYLGYDKTENAVNEATKCLATVRFSPASTELRPPGLPPHHPADRITTPQLPHHDLSAAEDYAHHPGGSNVPPPSQPTYGRKGKSVHYGMDESDPYGGISNAYDQQQTMYDDFGGSRGGQGGHVVWQGPTEDAVRGNHGQGRNGDDGSNHDYEYEQQRQLNAEEAAWQESQGHPPSGPGQARLPLSGVSSSSAHPFSPAPADDPKLEAPWQPLNVRRDRSVSPDPVSLRDGAPPTLDAPNMGESIRMPETGGDYVTSPQEVLQRPPPIRSMDSSNSRDGFYTPREGNTPEPTHAPLPSSAGPAPPAPLPLPSPIPPPQATTTYQMAPGSAKISAAAFRRKPRGTSLDPEETGPMYGSDQSRQPQSRKLPYPPGAPPPGTAPGGYGGMAGASGVRPETPIEASFELPASPTDRHRRDGGTFADVMGDASPPPMYGHDDSLR